MLKQTIDIDELVLKWDLDEERRNEKLEILRKWKAQLDKEEFEILLKICNEFTYYWEKLTAQAYKTIFERQHNLDKNFATFIEESLFMPLKRKDRQESTDTMYLNFTRVNDIDVNQTNMNGPVDYLKKYKKKRENASEKVKEHDQKNRDYDLMIRDLQSVLDFQNKNPKVKSKIQKRIKQYQFKKEKRENNLERMIKEDYNKYYSVKNLIIIDDFIGTGTSVGKLLKEFKEVLGNDKISINLCFLVIEASESGIAHVERIAKELGLKIQIIFGKISADVLAKDVIFNSDDLNRVKEVIQNINKKNRLKASYFCKNHAIATFINAPNNNLTLLSNNSSTWKALFLRINRIETKQEASKSEVKDIIQSLRQ